MLQQWRCNTYLLAWCFHILVDKNSQKCSHPGWSSIPGNLTSTGRELTPDSYRLFKSHIKLTLVLGRGRHTFVSTVALHLLRTGDPLFTAVLSRHEVSSMRLSIPIITCLLYRFSVRGCTHRGMRLLSLSWSTFPLCDLEAVNIVRPFCTCKLVTSLDTPVQLNFHEAT